jgi:hypothetical protein
MTWLLLLLASAVFGLVASRRARLRPVAAAPERIAEHVVVREAERRSLRIPAGVCGRTAWSRGPICAANGSARRLRRRFGFLRVCDAGEAGRAHSALTLHAPCRGGVIAGGLARIDIAVSAFAAPPQPTRL